MNEEEVFEWFNAMRLEELSYWKGVIKTFFIMQEAIEKKKEKGA